MKQKNQKSQKDTTSIRLNDEQKRILDEKAKERGVSRSTYIRDRALHGDEGLTPETMVRIQNLVNEAFEAIRYADVDKAISMEMEVNELWTLLK